MRLPPLNALRAFDAVARNGSVKEAASELFVTPAAVSLQIKQLEAWGGTPLFTRRVREMQLNERGASFHQATTRHLRAIAQAAAQLKPSKAVVTVTTVPSFASLWLVPRLAQFTDQFADVEVRIDADPRLMDLSRSEFDLAVREGGGAYPGCVTQLLFTSNAVPVAVPSLARELRKNSGRWQSVRLLHESVYASQWAQWFDGRGIAGVDATRGLHLSHTMLVLGAAKQAQGVALVPRFLVEDELAADTLALADDFELQVPIGYHLAWGKEQTLSPAAEAFRTWIIALAQADKFSSAHTPVVKSLRNQPPARRAPPAAQTKH